MCRIILCFLLLGSASLLAADNYYWASLGAGYLKPSDPRMAVQAEARGKLWCRYFRPQIGFLAERSDAAYLYGGLGLEVQFLPCFYFFPNFSPGIYFKGDGLNLGSAVEFRSCLEILYQLNCRLRLAGNFFHISNASISQRNPGVNGVIFSVAIAFK